MSAVGSRLGLPLLFLAALDVFCLVRLPRDRRRYLLPATIVLAVSSLVLFFGEWLLNIAGLSWRTWARTLLAAVVWLAGMAAGVLTIRYTWRCPTPKRWVNGAGCILALVCFCRAVCFGTVFGAFLIAEPAENVIDVEGRTVVQGTWSWLDTSYSLYEYHGPLVRGEKALAHSAQPWPSFCVSTAGPKLRGCARRFEKDRAAFETAAADASALADSENRTVEDGAGAVYPKGVDWMMVRPDGSVEFQLGCGGMASQTNYWGIVYTPEDTLAGCMGEELELVPYGDGWNWIEKEGDNWSYAEKLDDCWYAWYMHF